MKLQSLVITLVVILFASCNKNNETPENESLIFGFHRGGGWIGLDENLKITQDHIHYSVSYRDLHTSEKISYQTTIKTPHEQWEFLIKTFDFESFIKIQDGSCRSCVDGFDEIFSVTREGETYSFFNGDRDENFKQMQKFFDAILMQVNILSHKDTALKIGEITEIKSGETAHNAQYGLSLRVENVEDSRCPEGVMCVWEGYASARLHLTTENGNYEFTLDTHLPPIIKNDMVIDGFKYHLDDILPFPVWGEEQPIKMVKILVTLNNTK